MGRRRRPTRGEGDTQNKMTQVGQQMFGGLFLIYSLHDPAQGVTGGLHFRLFFCLCIACDPIFDLFFCNHVAGDLSTFCSAWSS